jgi:hypothetical protein
MLTNRGFTPVPRRSAVPPSCPRQASIPPAFLCLTQWSDFQDTEPELGLKLKQLSILLLSRAAHCVMAKIKGRNGVRRKSQRLGEPSMLRHPLSKAQLRLCILSFCLTNGSWSAMLVYGSSLPAMLASL